MRAGEILTCIGYKIFPTNNKDKQISITCLWPLTPDSHPKKGAAKKRAKLNPDETIPKYSIDPFNYTNKVIIKINKF